MTESETIAEWARFYRQILTTHYRAKFIVEFDPRLLPKLLDALKVGTAVELIESMRGNDE